MGGEGTKAHMGVNTRCAVLIRSYAQKALPKKPFWAKDDDVTPERVEVSRNVGWVTHRTLNNS